MSMIELKQTRVLTLREDRFLLELWREACWPEGTATGYRTATWLFYGFAAFLAIAVLMAVRDLNGIAAANAAQLAVAFVGCGGAHLFRQWQTQRLSDAFYLGRKQIGDCFQLRADGLHMTFDGIRSHCPWSSIVSVHNHDKWLIALFVRNATLLLAKDAFEGQDVEAFCRALEARALSA